MAASIFGASIAYCDDISVNAFSLNIIAVSLGIPLAFLLGSIKVLFQRHLIILSLVVLGFMAASLLSFDIEGSSLGSIWVNIYKYFNGINSFSSLFN
jgi:hypothetical protein